MKTRLSMPWLGRLTFPVVVAWCGLAIAADGARAGRLEQPTTAANDSTPSQSVMRGRLIDPQASPETVALFDNLRRLAARKQTLVGQQDPQASFGHDDGRSDILRLMAAEPAVWGSDFIHVTDAANDGANAWYRDEEATLRQRAIAAYGRGMVNVFCWHFRDPHRNAFYAREIDEEIRGGIVRSLLPGGTHHAWYVDRLRQVADICVSLHGADGTLAPVIFRPFHEFDGDWFWWGRPYCSADEFRELWKFTVRQLRDGFQVHNLVYCFTPDVRFESTAEFLERYPGDEYVDVVGFDDYHDFERHRPDDAARRLRIVSDLARTRGKLAALTEVGYREQPVPERLFTEVLGPALADPDLEIAFLMFWRQGRQTDDGGGLWFVPPPETPQAEDFRRLLASPRLLLLPQTPPLYRAVDDARP
jgi:mannan endo-1,4-beta-mannosidase